MKKVIAVFLQLVRVFVTVKQIQPRITVEGSNWMQTLAISQYYWPTQNV